MEKNGTGELPQEEFDRVKGRLKKIMAETSDARVVE